LSLSLAKVVTVMFRICDLPNAKEGLQLIVLLLPTYYCRGTAEEEGGIVLRNIGHCDGKLGFARSDSVNFGRAFRRGLY
jgi:hypothetical protein